MFRELYKEDNGLIAPEPSFIEELAEKMKREAAAAENAAFEPRRRVFPKAPLAAAAVLAVAGVFAVPIISIGGGGKMSDSASDGGGKMSDSALDGGKMSDFALDGENADYDNALSTQQVLDESGWSGADYGLNAYLPDDFSIGAFRYHDGEYKTNYIILPGGYTERFVEKTRYAEMTAHTPGGASGRYAELDTGGEIKELRLYGDGSITLRLSAQSDGYLFEGGHEARELYAELTDLAGAVYD
ncbi:MAG: hypothetical protein LBI38_03895 [Oscillospiraceae bacterium]|jgi:hypothetical protein|nr:hypothetical protein [Oscillospiraceae bacterium]